MHEGRTIFRGWAFPVLLLLPQLAVTVVFFLWPSFQAVRQSLYRENAFGFGSRYVGPENYQRLFEDSHYLASFWTTIVFSVATAVLAMLIALVLALAADRLRRGRETYTTIVVWPYAVAPALAGVLWLFLFDPSIGILGYTLNGMGIDWDPALDGNDAMVMVIAAAVWKQVSYNFIFFLAGLQAIPRSLIEAAAIDGATPWKRLRTIVLPLLTPTTFFLIVVNIVYAFFDTFGIIHATTEGGPVQSTTTLVYKAYADGFVGQNFGSSAAQSVVLTFIVVILTVAQFRFIERRVHY
jgi:sn-glycerol 3-phosphate transport system permease protein